MAEIRINETGTLKLFDADDSHSASIKAGTLSADVASITLESGETVFNEDSADIDFRVESNGDANMLFVDAGNDRVGIGTSSPGSVLQIDDQSTPKVTIRSVDGTSASVKLQRVDENDASTDYELKNDGGVFKLIGDNNSQDEYNLINSSTSEVVINEGSNDIDFRVEGNGDANLLFIDAGNDKIGIGTNAPAKLLSLKKDGGGGAIGIDIHNTGTNDADDSLLTFETQGHRNFSLGIDRSASAFVVMSEADGLGTARITVDDSGNIGIGTSAPIMSGYDSSSTKLCVHDASGSAQSGYLELSANSNTNGHNVGAIQFANDNNADATNLDGDGKTVAQIRAIVHTTDSNAGDDSGAQLQFFTKMEGSSLTEAGRFDDEANFMIGQTDSQGDTKFVVANASSDKAVIHGRATHSSYSGIVAKFSTVRSNNSAYDLLSASTDSQNDTEFRIRGDGNLFSDGGTTLGTPADYAEMFEWKDGNTDSEVRFGYSVILDGNKVVKASDSDDASKIIGVVSANPAVLGDAGYLRWSDKYLRDEYNKNIEEEYTATEWEETTYDVYGIKTVNNVWYETDKIPEDVTVPTDDVKDDKDRVIKTKAIIRTTEDDGSTKLKRRKLNPSFDASQTYIPRIERKEWDAIGMMGKLRLLKGQPTGTNWIKMRDISETVEEWLVR